MTTDAPPPQDEWVRQIFLTGEMEHFEAFMDLEAEQYHDLTFRDPGRVHLRLLGPLAHRRSTCWLVHGDRESILTPARCGFERAAITWGSRSIVVSPGMTLQQIYDRAVDARVDLCRALHLGLLRAVSLPEGCIRLLIAVSNFDNRPRFWLWVDGLTAELVRLGFRPAPSLGVPPVVPPASLPAALAAEPWLQIPDHRWDRHLLRLWWQGHPLKEIAASLIYSEKTLKNRLSALRFAYGEDIVPTRGQLRTLGLR